MKTLTALALLLLSTTLFAATLKGEVLEVRDAPPYTYLRLKTSEGETWAAVNQVPVNKGSQVTIDNPAVMENFKSKSLDRSFDRIVFGTIADPKSAAPTTSASPHASMGGGALNAPQPVVKVAKATGSDARTVSEVLAGKDALKDKRVSLRGQVVKANLGIMGKNWFHLQDGSGSAATGTQDVLVTSQDVAAVGDVITVQGTVRTDVKLGGGYDYAVMIESASLKK